MNEVKIYLSDRESELKIHLALLDILTERSKEAPTDKQTKRVNTSQLAILKSTILVHLYNIVEAVFARLLKSTASKAYQHHPKDYSEGLFNEWIAWNVKVTPEINIDRLRKTVAEVGEALRSEDDWLEFEIQKSGGNWSEINIIELSTKLGVTIDLEPSFKENLFKAYYNGLTQMGYIKLRRNDLAHGNMTFEEGAEGKTIQDLVELRDTVIEFMHIVVDAYTDFITNGEYLRQYQDVEPNLENA